MMNKTKALIEELNRTINYLTSEVNRLHHLDDKLFAIEKALDRTPDECRPGTWCAACEFGKEIVVPNKDRYTQCLSSNGRLQFYGKSIYVCNRAMSCSNFIQKEVPKDD